MEFTLDQLLKDFNLIKQHILESVKPRIQEISEFKECKTRNQHFTGFFRRQKHELVEKYTPIKGQDHSPIIEYTFTKAAIDEFQRWQQVVSLKRCLDFFHSEKRPPINRKNLHELRTMHLQESKKFLDNVSAYGDIDLLEKLEPKKLYLAIITSLALDSIIRIADEISDENEDKIEDVMSHLDRLKPEHFIPESLNNRFNSATPLELIDFFADLKKVAIGQVNPIVSNLDFNKLIESICNNYILEDPIDSNLNKKQQTVLRRLFFDFFDHFSPIDQTRTPSLKLNKIEYLKFIQSFKYYQGVVTPSWVDNTTANKQKKTLKEILA